MKEGQWELDPAIRDSSSNVESGMENAPDTGGVPADVAGSTVSALGGFALAGSADDSAADLIGDLDSYVEAGYSEVDSSGEVESEPFMESSESDTSESFDSGGESVGDFGGFG